jgi:hypothetical protein
MPHVRAVASELPAIPVVDVGPNFAMETAEAIGEERAYAMLDDITRWIPDFVIRGADRVSRTWLRTHRSPYLEEIEALAKRSKRPGAYFLNVNYEWGCTTAAKPSPDGRSTRLLRTLDWVVSGLGRHVVAARIASRFGPWMSLTWPGFTGVLQACAPGRFAAAINQPNIRKRTGLIPIDWALGKRDVWRSPHLQPAHLLRRVFEEAPDFAAARHMLETVPITTPVIYTLAGIRPEEGCVIERRQTSASIVTGCACAANEWQSPDWRRGHFRAWRNAPRFAAMQACAGTMDLSWLKPPILHRWTRLAMVADAAEGRMVAQGYEKDGAATGLLELSTKAPTPTARAPQAVAGPV